MSPVDVQDYKHIPEIIAERVCRKLPKNEDPQDILQEAYMGLLEAIGKFKQQAGFKSYCSKIIRGRIFDYLRKSEGYSRKTKKKADSVSLNDDTPYSAEMTVGQSAEFELNKTHYVKPEYCIFKDLIQFVPEKYQEIFRLFYEENYRQKEIGRMFGYSESRICQILIRANDKIKIAVAKEQKVLMVAA